MIFVFGVILIGAARFADSNSRAGLALAVMAHDVFVSFSVVMSRLQGHLPEPTSWTHSTPAVLHLCAEALAFMGVAALEMMKSNPRPAATFRV